MWRWPLIVFSTVFLIHALSPLPLSGDSRWTVLVAESILEHGDTTLDEYFPAVQATDYYGVECVHHGEETFGKAMGPCSDGHVYNWYPVGGPLVAIPFVFTIHRALLLMQPILRPVAERPGMPPLLKGFFEADLIAGHAIIESITASFLIAVTSVLLYFFARRDLSSHWAAGLAFVYAFGTSAWSTGSRAMFQHTPSMLLLMATVLLLTKPNLVGWTGLTASFAYVVRPTNALLFAGVALYVLIRHRESFLKFCEGAAVVLGCFAAYNLSAFGHLRSSYYSVTPPAPDARLLASLAGNLFSPGRGLFIYTPILLFSIGGMVRAWRTRWQRPLPLLWMALILGHWIGISLFTEFWWGGHAYGPRLFLDVVPLFVLFLIPMFQQWQFRRTLAAYSFAAALAFCVVIHGRASISPKPQQWNVIPSDVDQHPERVWDWRDPAFLR